MRHDQYRQIRTDTAFHPEFISDMAKRNERFIILLGINKILSAKEMVALNQD
ncbi:MAG: hypothetical protein LUQ11_00900 [Methylococcaceae bacterium]|nr:hypothetical protein [Methylococcaceae bacterium]